MTAGVNASVDGSDLWLTPADMVAATGWKLESQGLCRGDACLRAHAGGVDRRHGRIDLTALSAYLGQSMVRDDDALAFGESVATRHDALFSLQAPDFTLLDIDGKLHSLSGFRGKKVFMYSWGFLLRLLV